MPEESLPLVPKLNAPLSKQMCEEENREEASENHLVTR